jgi:hypothetical protein
VHRGYVYKAVEQQLGTPILLDHRRIDKECLSRQLSRSALLPDADQKVLNVRLRCSSLYAPTFRLCGAGVQMRRPMIMRCSRRPPTADGYIKLSFFFFSFSWFSIPARSSIIRFDRKLSSLFVDLCTQMFCAFFVAHIRHKL